MAAANIPATVIPLIKGGIFSMMNFVNSSSPLLIPRAWKSAPCLMKTSTNRNWKTESGAIRLSMEI